MRDKDLSSSHCCRRFNRSRVDSVIKQLAFSVTTLNLLVASSKLLGIFEIAILCTASIIFMTTKFSSKVVLRRILLESFCLGIIIFNVISVLQ